jgi:hypothetical protein
LQFFEEKTDFSGGAALLISRTPVCKKRETVPLCRRQSSSVLPEFITD